MNIEEIFARLQVVFDDIFPRHVEVRPELTAKEVPEWDSLLHISLVVSMEQAFGIRFRLGEVEEAKNMQEIAEIIRQRLG